MSAVLERATSSHVGVAGIKISDATIEMIDRYALSGDNLFTPECVLRMFEEECMTTVCRTEAFWCLAVLTDLSLHDLELLHKGREYPHILAQFRKARRYSYHLRMRGEKIVTRFFA